jgi:hypothetical protein
VTIGTVPTRNISCVANVCTPTEEGAYLNADDLQAMLATGSVTVKSLEISKNIVVNAPLTWTSGVTLTLDSYESLTLKKALSVTGTGGLTMLTNDGGTKGVLSIGGYGHVTFASLASPLTINGKAYTLVNSIPSLAHQINANSNGLYALANDYGAKADGVYANSPVTASFSGTFDGLGNSVTGLEIMALKERSVGLFSTVNGGAIRHIKLIRIKIRDKDEMNSVGSVIGRASQADLFEVSVSGVVQGSRLSAIGGLVGYAELTAVDNCHANVEVSGGNKSFVGGLVGYGDVAISNSYAMGSVSVAPLTGPPSRHRGYAGGLMGEVDGSVDAAYSTASVGDPTGNVVGGVFGLEGADVASTNNYWDTTTSGITNPGQGAGLPANAPGITGLTTAQLRAGLPAGFDPTVWGQDPAINGGLPYLLDDPPL